MVTTASKPSGRIGPAVAAGGGRGDATVAPSIIGLTDSLFVRYLDYVRALHVRLLFPPDIGEIDETVARHEREILAAVSAMPSQDTPCNAVSIIAAILDKAISESRAMQTAIRGGAPLSRDAYDVFMRSQLDLLRAIKRVERAMMQATSDLDALTGLHNRQAMNRDLERERARAERTGAPFSIALADLDRFKSINDRFGHKAGDIVLAATAEIFLNSIRPYDIVYRYGGEEFLIYLHDAPADVAVAILRRVLGKLTATPIKIGEGREIRVSSSFGVAEGGADLTLSQIIDRADQALYQAKAAGRRQVRLHTPETVAGEA